MRQWSAYFQLPKRLCGHGRASPCSVGALRAFSCAEKHRSTPRLARAGWLHTAMETSQAVGAEPGRSEPSRASYCINISYRGHTTRDRLTATSRTYPLWGSLTHPARVGALGSAGVDFGRIANVEEVAGLLCTRTTN